MEKNKHTLILGTLLIAGFTSILADVPIPTDPKEAELDALLKKSEEQLKKVTLVAQSIDKVSTEKVVEMEKSIESLQEANEQLTTEINEVKSTIESINNSAIPFELGPILPDTTSGGK